MNRLLSERAIRQFLCFEIERVRARPAGLGGRQSAVPVFRSIKGSRQAGLAGERQSGNSYVSKYKGSAPDRLLLGERGTSI